MRIKKTAKNLTDRIEELMPEIEMGMIIDIEVNKRINLRMLSRNFRGEKIGIWFKADLFYHQFLSKYPGAKSLEMVEMFERPVNMAAYKVKRDIFLRKSGRVRVIEHFAANRHRGRYRSRGRYRDMIKRGSTWK